MKNTIATVAMLICSLLHGCASLSNEAKAADPLLCIAHKSEFLSAFLDVYTVQSIVIDDGWMGLSLIAPITAKYELHTEDTNFTGLANFSVGPDLPRKPATRATENLIVPKEIVSRFLQQIAATPIVPGKYEPEFTHTDDYPSISIELKTDKKHVIFSSTSQSKDRSPWKIADGKQECISRSAIPADALALLKPYLKQDLQKALIEREQMTAKELMKESH